MALPGDPALTGKAKYRKTNKDYAPKKKAKPKEKPPEDYTMDELMGKGWRNPPKPKDNKKEGKKDASA